MLGRNRALARFFISAVKSKSGFEMGPIRRIALVTDFDRGGPYTGQMILRLADLAPNAQAFELVSNLPPYRADLAAYFLPALVRDIPEQTLFLCVVDPEVGGDREVIILEADGCWYVGPDNGLLSVVARRARESSIRRVTWRPDRLSNSFHGRDLFCPMAAMLAKGMIPETVSVNAESMVGANWPEELPGVVYVDGFGNLITGIRAVSLMKEAVVHVGGQDIAKARTFCEVPSGEVFWYENSFGLVELAVNQGRADLLLKLEPGDPIDVSLFTV